jgi:hypothetical protein
VDVTALDIAFVSSVAALAGAVAGPVSTLLAGWRDRAGARRERHFQVRSDTYVALLEGMSLLQAIVDRSYPDDPGREISIPGPLSDAQLFYLNARVMAFGSPRVANKFDATGPALTEATAISARIAENGGVLTDELRAELAAVRKRIHEVVEDLGREIRDELAAL